MTKEVQLGESLRRANWVRRSGYEKEDQPIRHIADSNVKRIYLIDTTSQSLATAALQILLPKKPLPPQTTIFRLAEADAAAEAIFVSFLFFLLKCPVSDVLSAFDLSRYRFMANVCFFRLSKR